MSDDRSRSALQALRVRVAEMETPGRRGFGVLPFGLASLDQRLPGGGLARGALHEVAGAGARGGGWGGCDPVRGWRARPNGRRSSMVCEAARPLCSGLGSGGAYARAGDLCRGGGRGGRLGGLRRSFAPSRSGRRGGGIERPWHDCVATAASGGRNDRRAWLDRASLAQVTSGGDGDTQCSGHALADRAPACDAASGRWALDCWPWPSALAARPDALSGRGGVFARGGGL